MNGAGDTGSRLRRLSAEGQSAWLDNLRRSWLADGTIQRWIDEGVVGITSNPAIFRAAIEGSSDYDEQLFAELATSASVEDAYWSMVVDDIAAAATLLEPVYRRTGGIDGYVSVEVDPRLAHDTDATVAAAMDLVGRLPQPNVMIKVPATVAGVAAIRTLTAAGVCVNATLIFSLDRYAAVWDAFVDGLEAAAGEGVDLARVASVASFFVSRVDTEIDRRLREAGAPESLQGRAAVAQARLAYEHFAVSRTSARWVELERRGARPQRPLWASTSTKNPEYPDTLYVDSLIGPETVNTVPDATLAAFVDHGTVARTIDADVGDARATWEAIAAKVDVDDVAAVLEADGVASFVSAFTDVLESLESKAAQR